MPASPSLAFSVILIAFLPENIIFIIIIEIRQDFVHAFA